MPEHVILQIETATQVCSVALSANGDPLAFRDIDEPNVHASRLTLLIADVLREAGLTFTDVAAVAVSKGPGSYTGLRIGVSTAKGLAYARDLPLIGIDTLAAMAAGFAAEHAAVVDADTWLCPMIDARRMEVYSAIYDHQLRPVSGTQAAIIDHASFDYLPPERKVVLFGSGADKLAALFEDNHQVAVITGFKNSARYLSSLADQAFIRKDVVDVVYFEPYYLKDFVATVSKK